MNPSLALLDAYLAPFGERPTDLMNVATHDLISELLARYGKTAASYAGHAQLDAGYHLQHALDLLLDVHWNRFSATCLRNSLSHLLDAQRKMGLPTPETTVELGCGSWNPGGRCFALLMLGSKRAYGIDLDFARNTRKAVRGLADLAKMMLVDPKRIIGKNEVTPNEMLDNIATFDLAKLESGDQSGIDVDRLRHCICSAEATPVSDREADLVYSSSFLEHVIDLDAVLLESARITRPGGIGVHVIDASDHLRYTEGGHSPLDYLRADRVAAQDSEIVRLRGNAQMNRIRPHEFSDRFEKAGFKVVDYKVLERIEVTEQERDSFDDPYRLMDLEDLCVTRAKLVVRRDN